MQSAEQMESHAPIIAKKLWNVLRITFFMIRKGFISKRKLIMDMNLTMKKGKLLRKSLSNILSLHHHHQPKSVARGGCGPQEYEFSCSNSPNPYFSHLSRRHRPHFNFPCINHPQVDGEEEGDVVEPNPVVLVPLTPEYAFNFKFDASDFAAGERKSPFSVRISNYSAEDENVEDGGNGQIDDEAEDFIRRFYEQLRVQRRMQLLQYQDM